MHLFRVGSIIAQLLLLCVCRSLTGSGQLVWAGTLGDQTFHLWFRQDLLLLALLAGGPILASFSPVHLLPDLFFPGLEVPLEDASCILLNWFINPWLTWNDSSPDRCWNFVTYAWRIRSRISFHCLFWAFHDVPGFVCCQVLSNSKHVFTKARCHNQYSL